MPYLVRVPLRPVCLSANCTNHSATLVMHDFINLFGNAICLTPARRQKIYIDRAEIKPRFFKPPVRSLIKAPSLDFKGPVRGECSYLLVAVDEYSCFPCKNMKSSTVIACLSSLFCVFGFPGCVHSDRGSSFVGQEMRTFLSARGISVSTSTAYHRYRYRLGTASANGSTKPFGEPFSYCTDVVFLSIDGRMCWTRLFTPSDRSSACLLMKLSTRGCFVSLGDL